MRIDVRFFASLADGAGTALETVDVPAGTDVAGLWRLLAARHPAFASMTYRPMAACDLDYADWGRVLDNVREVAFLPPVSGG